MRLLAFGILFDTIFFVALQLKNGKIAKKKRSFPSSVGFVK